MNVLRGAVIASFYAVALAVAGIGMVVFVIYWNAEGERDDEWFYFFVLGPLVLLAVTGGLMRFVPRRAPVTRAVLAGTVVLAVAANLAALLTSVPALLLAVALAAAATIALDTQPPPGTA